MAQRGNVVIDMQAADPLSQVFPFHRVHVALTRFPAWCRHFIFDGSLMVLPATMNTPRPR